MKTNLIIAVLILFIAPISTSAQFHSFSQWIKSADEAYNNGHYNKALAYYTEALKVNDALDQSKKYKLADAAYQVRSLDIATQYFTEFLESPVPEFENKALKNIAHSYQLKGDYANAKIYYDLYLSEYSDIDPSLTEKIQLDRNASEWAETTVIENTIDTVLKVPGSINTPYSELSPFLYDEELLFSSMRFPISKDLFLRYKSKILTEQNTLEIDNVDSNMLLSNPVVIENSNMILFTVCNYIETYNITCKIYKGTIDSTGLISAAMELPEPINREGYTSTHPSVRVQGDMYKLYYSTNRIGGKGGLDIWQVNFDKDFNFKSPTIVKGVNTKYDEITPFFHEEKQLLFFSSNGRNGYGGYDVYQKAVDEDSIQNVGKPVNTSLDDIYFKLDKEGNTGYMSSNRPGSYYAEETYETCCYDIYKVEYKVCEIELRTLAFNSKTKALLDSINVTIKNKVTGETYVDNKNVGHEAVFELPCDEELTLLATKAGYENLEVDLSDLEGTYGEANEALKELYLTPKTLQLTVAVFEELEKQPLTGADIYLTNLSTNEQVSSLNNPGHISSFTILPNTEYLIEINKEGFKEASVRFNSGDGDVDITKDLILKYLDIVQKSMASLENAIPVSLFFDNDMPDKGSKSNTSSMTYTETYSDYYNKKDKFKNAYFSIFKGSDKLIANQEIENLFANHIRKGFDKYDVFKRQLQIVLESGQEVNIYLRGYTSPIAQSDYNIALGKRRVDSIRKEFDTWNNGVFLNYLKSGQLKVTERSFGETTSPASVSDDPSAPSKSIFSPEASLERRVEIDEINFNEQ